MSDESAIVRDSEGKPIALYLPVERLKPIRQFKRGDRVSAFAYWLWEPVGDVGDNSCFWKPATVLHFYYRNGDGWLADLLFDCGRESHAHFAYGLKPLIGDS